jgi:hypothetical protein
MAVTRFYRPQQQQHISQFVPENLGVMQNALDRTQARADKTQEGMDIYQDGLLKRNAFGESDTAYLKGKREGFDKFVADLSTKELSDPQVARDAANYIRQLKGDEGLGKVQKAYDHNVEAQANWEKIIGTAQDNPANYEKYRRSAEQYGKTGYKGEGLASNAFRPDTKIRPELENAVNDIKAIGYSQDVASGKWIHSGSKKEISGDRLMTILNDAAPSFMDSAAGRQLRANAEYDGVSVSDAFNEIATSIANERSYVDEGHGLKANSNYILDKEEEDDRPIVTSLPSASSAFGNYKDRLEADNAAEELDLTDPYAASAIRASINEATSEYSKDLPDNQKELISSTYNSLMDEYDPNKAVKGATPGSSKYKELLDNTIEALKETAKSGGAIGKGGSKSATNDVKIRPDESDMGYANRLYELTKNTPKSYTEEKLYNNKGKRLGVKRPQKVKLDYENAMTAGNITKGRSFLAVPGKGDVTSNDYINESFSGAITDVNFSVKGDNPRPIKDLVRDMDETSFHMDVHGGKGTTIRFDTKGDDDNLSEPVTITRKPLGRNLRETDYMYQLVKAKYGNSEEFRTIIDGIDSQNYAAVESKSNLSQTEKMFGKKDGKGVSSIKKYGRWNLNRKKGGITLNSLDLKENASIEDPGTKKKVRYSDVNDKIKKIRSAGYSKIADHLEKSFDIHETNGNGEVVLREGEAIFKNESQARRMLKMLYSKTIGE